MFVNRKEVASGFCNTLYNMKFSRRLNAVSLSGVVRWLNREQTNVSTTIWISSLMTTQRWFSKSRFVCHWTTWHG